MDTIHLPVAAVGEAAAAQLTAALQLCVREYRRAVLDCPLAAGLVALHRRRRTDGGVPDGTRRLDDTIRNFVLGDAPPIAGVYLEAAAACRRASAPCDCPLKMLDAQRPRAR